MLIKGNRDQPTVFIHGVEEAETVGLTLDGFELSNVELREGNRLCFASPFAEAVKMNVETPTAIKEARLVVLVFIAVTEGASSRPAAPNFRR